MNNSKTFSVVVNCALVLFCCYLVSVKADDTVTYSPEQWPKRWSSAIRHEQNSNNYPERDESQSINEQGGEVFSDQDLFYNSPEERHLQRRHKRRRGWERQSRFADHSSQYRNRARSSGMRRYPNSYMRAPYAYGAYPYAYGSPGYMGYPGYLSPYTGYGLYGPSPLLAPGLGLGYPGLLGSPLGYPYPGLPGAGLLGGPFIW